MVCDFFRQLRHHDFFFLDFILKYTKEIQIDDRRDNNLYLQSKNLFTIIEKNWNFI